MFFPLLPAANKTLQIWEIDSEGAKSELLVSPDGESMLIDTGFPGYHDRDANRILEACKDAGVTKLDFLVITHYDMDHVDDAPAVAKKIPITTFVDHGPAAVHDFGTTRGVAAYDALWANAKHMVVKPGDKIPFKGVEVEVITSASQHIQTPLRGGGKPNAACAVTQHKVWTRPPDEDVSENANSLSLLITYGRFRMMDMGDLTWNKEIELMCPNNPVGKVDLFITGNHGNDNASSPALVDGLDPRLIVMDNGERKFGAESTMKTLRAVPGLQALYLLHWSANAPNDNPPDEYIANLHDSPDGKWLKITADQKGVVTVTNQRTGDTKTYNPR
ncbi:MAG TPA: MBL fold metallo-hydrolase [Bryobacteraceae bacterium]|nr:MBL fold metallo-hydrolase [Bryobacteraceae bacterium]